ncbi:hypothetical protein STEG23_030125 [Scotinomys teguina]
MVKDGQGNPQEELMTSDSLKSTTEMPHCGKGEQQDSATIKMLHHRKDRRDKEEEEAGQEKEGEETVTHQRREKEDVEMTRTSILGMAPPFYWSLIEKMPAAGFHGGISSTEASSSLITPFRAKLTHKTSQYTRIVRETPISGVRTFYTDANKQGKAGYKSEDLSKVVQSPYNSVQKSELYAILLVLMDFSEPLNIVTDSQYAERVVLHIETAEFIPDESELTSLFIQLQDIIRNRKHPLYITHIRSHTGLPGPLAQGNDEIDKLLIGNVLEASEFHKKHHVNSKGLKRDFSITWQQAKEIVRKCPTCSFYNQTPLPAGCNPKGTQRNDIWQMDVFHFAEFGKLKYVHHTIDTYSGFQWATALSSEKADSVITHLLEVIAIMGIPAQIKTDNAPAYVSGKMKQFFAYYNIKHITGIPHNPTGQAVIERSNRTLKDMLNKQKGVTKTPRNRLHNALLTLNFLNANEKGTTAAERHWIIEKTAELNQPIYFKDVLTSEWKPGYVLRWGRGFAFISTGEDKLWIPSKLIKVRFEQKTS